MYVSWGETQTKWRIQMRKGIKQNNVGKADTVSKYECVGRRQKNGEHLLIRQALHGGNVYE
jgi:hypothetical protein